MPRKKSRNRKKRQAVGIEAVVESGVGALYVRCTWMKKLKELGEGKRKPIKRSRGKQK